MRKIHLLFSYTTLFILYRKHYKNTSVNVKPRKIYSADTKNTYKKLLVGLYVVSLVSHVVSLLLKT